MKKHVLFTISIFLIFIVLTPTAFARLTTITPPIQDTYIVEKRPFKNYSSLSSMNVYFSSTLGWSRSLVQFDVSSIPDGAIVNSATLTLRITGLSSIFTDMCAIYQVTSEWSEDEVTSQIRNTTRDWSTYGGDYKFEDGVSTIFPFALIDHQVDVTEIVKNWIEDDEPNYGFLIKAIDESPTSSWFIQFGTKDSVFGEWQPTLKIDWDRKPVRTQRGSVHGVCSYVIQGGVDDSGEALQIKLKNLKKSDNIEVEINYNIRGNPETSWIGSPITLLKKESWTRRTYEDDTRAFNVGDLVDIKLIIDGTHTIHETVLMSSQTLH